MTINDCPFCNAAAALHIGPVWSGRRIDHLFRVDCTGQDCEARGPMKPTTRQAVEAWNRATDGPDEVSFR